MEPYLILKALNFLRLEINHSETRNEGGDFAVLENISNIESSSGASSTTSRNSVFLTIVNIEEESTLKNNPYYIRRGDGIEKRNPTVFLNLYILFSCPAEGYANALRDISRVVGFFQRKNVFTRESASPGASGEFPERVEKILLDMVSLNFEQLNHLWGVLGGKYMPSVLYKLRLIPIQYSDSGPVELVEEIETQSNVSN